MELDPKAFFKKYGLSQKSSESNLKDYFEELNDESPIKMITLSKNLTLLRILDIARKLKGLKKKNIDPSNKVQKVFKAKRVKEIIDTFSKEYGASVPDVTMKGIPSLILLLFTLIWIVLLAIVSIKFLWNHIEIFLSGIDLVILTAPVIIIILLAPIGILSIVFPNTFASAEIVRVNTLHGLADKIYTLNRDLHTKNDYQNAINDVMKIREDSSTANDFVP